MIIIQLTLLFLCLLSSQCDAYDVDYNIYHTYQRTLKELQAMSFRYPDIIKVENHHTRTVKGNMLVLYRISDYSYPIEGKIKTLLTFGEHARELVVIESFLDLMHNLTSGYRMPCHSASGQYSRFILQHIELHVIGIMNPDGKVIMENTNEMCFRKNANLVDINRNMGWEFGGKGSSNNKNNEEYRGTHAFSEVETMWIKSIVERTSFDLFMSIHSGEQQVFVPFVDTFSKKISRRRDHINDELALVNRILKDSKGFFRNGGIAYEMNEYTADGTLMDYMAGVMNIRYCFTIEIWGGPFNENCFVQFNPEPVLLQREIVKMRSLYTSVFFSLIEEYHHKTYKYRTSEVWLDICTLEMKLK